MPLPETEYALAESYQVTLATVAGVVGTATVLYKGPTRAGERWVIENTSVTTTSGCIFQVFRGPPDNNKQIDYTSKGLGDSSDTVTELRNGDSVSFKWSSGTNGAIGVVRIEGKRFIPGRRAY